MEERPLAPSAAAALYPRSQGHPPSSPGHLPRGAAGPLTCLCISSICLWGMLCKMLYTSDIFSSGTTTDALETTAGQFTSVQPISRSTSTHITLFNSYKQKREPPSRTAPILLVSGACSSPRPAQRPIFAPPLAAAFVLPPAALALPVTRPHRLCTAQGLCVGSPTCAARSSCLPTRNEQRPFSLSETVCPNPFIHSACVYETLLGTRSW